MKKKWIDTHIHVSDLGPDGSKRERMLSQLLAVLDRCDADLSFVISCDGPYQAAMIKDPSAILRGNRMIHDLVRQAPERLYGSCIVNPNFLAESLQAMDICFGQWGFVQLGEMLPYIHDYKMDCEETAQLVRAAADFDVPVQVHLGTYWLKDATACCDGMVQMRDLLHCVDRVPDAKYILAHAIGCGPTPDYLSWADMYLDTISGLFPAYPDNFWVEIRDFQCPALPRAVAEIPGTRLLAGTDWTTRVGPPFQAYGTMFEVRQQDNPFPPQVQSFVSFLRQAGASEETIVRIGSENARALYRL